MSPHETLVCLLFCHRTALIWHFAFALCFQPYFIRLSFGIAKLVKLLCRLQVQVHRIRFFCLDPVRALSKL